MTDSQTSDDAGATRPAYRMPVVRTISGADVRAALAAGLDDFRAAPMISGFFGLKYALAGLAIVASVMLFHLSWLAYPLAAGFTLVGPFAAVGLYEVSRRLETGQPVTWSGVLGVIFAQRGRELRWMAFVTLFIFLMWMYQIRLLLALFLGFSSFTSFGGFLETVFTTFDGLMFLAIGHVIGAALSLLVFSLTVVSFPLLLDRDVDFITAMITSVKSVTMNPLPMVVWAFCVVAMMIVAAAPMFLGLLVVLPVLGHTTWHLYRKVVAPA